jgi:hypothetical protein
MESVRSALTFEITGINLSSITPDYLGPSNKIISIKYSPHVKTLYNEPRLLNTEAFKVKVINKIKWFQISITEAWKITGTETN